MAEPEGDLPNIQRRLERVHGAGVAQDVRRDASLCEGALLAHRGSNVLGENVLEPGAGHDLAGRVEEQLGISVPRADREPGFGHARNARLEPCSQSPTRHGARVVQRYVW
jgi:hypothetical protein